MSKFKIDPSSLVEPNIKSPTEHAVLSPSSASRWSKCTASIRMIQEHGVQQEANEFALEGTAMHEAAAHALEGQKKASDLLGMEFFGYTVGPDDVRALSKYIDYVYESSEIGDAVWIEKRFSMEAISERMFGTSDASIVREDQIEIIDLKYGKGVVVEPEENLQMMIYAIGVILYLASQGVKLPSDFPVKTTIIQPRAPHPDGPVRSWVTTIGHLRNVAKTLREKAKETKGEGKFHPDDGVCRWCEAKANCRAHADYMLKQAKLEFQDLLLGPTEFSERCGGEAMTDDEMAQVLKHSKAFESWFKAIANSFTSRLKKGEEVEGYKLVYGRSYRRWGNEKKAIEEMEALGLAPELMYEKKLISVAKLEKALPKGGFDMFNDLVIKPKGKMILAPVSDPRQPVTPNMDAADEFKDLV